ncbi:hypothetical protein ASG92_21455 [Arthrobacter sp. Soil736]|uniref:response regulator n=1 Tax=Arthrobacter sp. Soil736 TaxID=1736395 RepID=UPI0006F755EE|nr:response regulator [Arthrobacter sp. Soil736]KRE60523.1 hypothetical protein ASG92_21455 [Arthrobacter sp. Soil736]
METRGVCLVIEDDEDLRNLLTALLSGAGFEVRSAATGADGLKQAMDVKASLVTVDLNLPDMPGEDFARQLRQV